jgi:S-formylglutathione hydrolase FrmB
MALGAAVLAMIAVPAAARTERITVHGAALVGNLEGNAVDREAYVFLPPSYDAKPKKRYPVVYFLHGFFATPKMYDDLVKFQDAVDAAAAAGNEVIMVMPDAHTVHKGAFYSASPTTGDFATFVARDLVGHMDRHFRTIAAPASRGLSGHSMGGYGTLKIALTHPGVFSSIYAMAACCMTPRVFTIDQLQKIAATTPEQAAAATMSEAGALAVLAAWAPDPKNAPTFIDKGIRDGAVDPVFTGRIAANSPLVLLPQHLDAIRGLKAIALDVGDKDSLKSENQLFSDALTQYGIAHSFEIFEGEHGNRVAPRIRSKLLPFFGQHLAH